MGCGGEPAQEDLQRYIDSIKARKSFNIEPIPKLQTSLTYHYPKNHVRDPFVAVVEKRVSEANAPDQDRPKQRLENFALDSLRMVGVLRENEQTWAVVSAPDGGVYRVNTGNFLGKNYGKVTKINAKTVEIEELVRMNGAWEKRTAKLALVEGE